ncbi:DUF5777 family beta-barrel protein [Gaoshiqia sp. Z1-71]|uniref:DUF5777 family beta-barrel protein n=1 Tax=Gaoshiqia hydrogeniformans TaxID=3290090 RepID=UPI003BF8DC2A
MRFTFLLLILIGICAIPAAAQDDPDRLFHGDEAEERSLAVVATFKSPRIINGQSNETIHKNDLLFTVMHRFGDIAGDFGGARSFFGLDNSTDILVGFDYGISDRLSAGLGRAKGAPNGTSTDQNQLFYIHTKYRLLQQTGNDRMPFSVTLFGNSVVSATEKREQTTSDAGFQKFGDRMSYVAQVIIARKFSNNLSLALSPSYIRRNYVSYMDMNDLFALGLGGRMKISPWMAVVIDYFLSFRSQESKDYFREEKDFRLYNPLGAGLEIETGGHVFNLSFMNSTAILENQFIPATSSSWGKGGFRWGFSITRTFAMSDKSKSPENP